MLGLETWPITKIPLELHYFLKLDPASFFLLILNDYILRGDIYFRKLPLSFSTASFGELKKNLLALEPIDTAAEKPENEMS